VHSASIITGGGGSPGANALLSPNDGGTIQRTALLSDDGFEEAIFGAGLSRGQKQSACVLHGDSGGAFLHKGEIFPDERHFGRIFYNQARCTLLQFRRVSQS